MQSLTPPTDPKPNEKVEPERPFLCTVCNHRFIRATHLRRHMRIHTGEKPFTCHICGQRYARGDYLRAHIQAHRKIAFTSASIAESIPRSHEICRPLPSQAQGYER